MPHHAILLYLKQNVDDIHLYQMLKSFVLVLLFDKQTKESRRNKSHFKDTLSIESDIIFTIYWWLY